MKTLLVPMFCLMFVALPAPGLSQEKRQPLSIEKAQTLIDAMLIEDAEDVSLRVTKVLFPSHEIENQMELPDGYAWCDVFKEGLYVGSMVIPFNDGEPENTIWSNAFLRAVSMDSQEKAQVLLALDHFVDVWLRIERGAERLDQILPDNLAGYVDQNGKALGVFSAEDIQKHSSARIYESIRAILDAMPLVEIAVHSGHFSDEQRETFEETLGAGDDPADTFWKWTAPLSALRKELQSVDPERVKDLKTLLGGMLIGQVHKDLNEHDGNPIVQGLPVSAALYHIGEEHAGFLLAWFGDQLRIVCVNTD